MNKKIMFNELDELNELNELDELLDSRFKKLKEYIQDISFIYDNKEMSFSCQFDNIVKNKNEYMFEYFFHIDIEYDDIGCVLKSLFSYEFNAINVRIGELNNFLNNYTSKDEDEYFIKINKKNIHSFLQGVKPLLEKLDNRIQVLINNIKNLKKYNFRIIDNSLISDQSSNGGKYQSILLMVKNNLYRITILSESSVSQSYANLHIKDNNGWTILIHKNPKKNYDIDISHSKGYNKFNSFNPIIKDLIQKIMKLEEENIF